MWILMMIDMMMICHLIFNEIMFHLEREIANNLHYDTLEGPTQEDVPGLCQIGLDVQILKPTQIECLPLIP